MPALRAVEMPLIVLFDDGRGRFGPLTDLRATFELRTSRDTAIEALRPAALWARPELAPLVTERTGLPVNRLPAGGDAVLLVNGRYRREAIDPRDHATPGRVCVEKSSGDVVAACLSRAEAERFLAHGELPKTIENVTIDQPALFARPWDLFEPVALGKRLTAELLEGAAGWSRAVPKGVLVIGDAPVWIHTEARVSPSVILDAEGGPISIDAGAIIRPGAVIVGPTFIGAHTIVGERTLLKGRCVIGPHCRIAGEIGSTIFQGYANKAHEGHLGDSFIGEWVNLGAGTTNSNLLNTYGDVTVRLEPDAPIERSGRQFVGSIVGDHVKTAILTRLPTGCVLGTGAMIASSGFAPASVPRFAWLTDAGQRCYRFEKFLDVARAVWKRRRVEPSAAMIDALRRLHEHAARRFESGAGAGTSAEAARDHGGGEAR